MGKKSRFLTMFYKKPAVFCSIFLIMFCLGTGEAFAKLCNRYNPTSAGEFCKASSVQTCRAGCYCTGSKKSIEEIDVEKYCKERKTHDKYINNDTYGVYLCPSGKTSNAGAKKASDCFSPNDAATQPANEGVKTVTEKGKSCSKNKIAGPGLYCGASLTKECKPGCFCPGNGNGSFTWLAGDVEKGCKEKWSKVTTELNSKGVFLCDAGYTSNAGAKSKADCYKIEDATSSDTATSGKTCSNKKPAPAGSYCGATITKKCKPGCYCEGGGNFTWLAGDVEKGCKERWNKVTDELNEKGVYLCPAGFTTIEGAGSLSDCFLNGHSDIKYQEITCEAGEYLPANSKDCTPCRTDSYCDGITNAVPSNKDQGITKCQEGLIPNDDHTGCHEPADTECAAGQYLPAGTTKCQTCPDGYACPGGTSDAIKCISFTSVSDDKTTCVATNVTCDAGYYLPTNLPQCTPCNGATETAGKVCKGGVLTPSETAPAGLESCVGTMVPNKEQTSCVAASTNSITCNAGYYLPMNSKECTACPERKKCTGGTFEFNATADQGIDAIKEYAITKDMLAFGTGNADSPLESQCWYIVNFDKYKECISNALKQFTVKDKTTEKLVTKNTNTQKQTPSSISATGIPSTLANISDSKIDKSTIDMGSPKTTVPLGGKATGINLKF